jgi:hypothetical protein
MPLMIKLVFAAGLVAASQVFAFAQAVTISADSSRIIFPNNVQIPFSMNRKAGRVYQFTQSSMSTLIVQSNYLFQKSALQNSAAELMRRQMLTKDSTLEVSNIMIVAERKRAELYRSSYNELKKVSNEYDTHTNHLINELERITRQNRKEKRKLLVRGTLAGLTVGFITGIYITKKQ